MFIPYYQAVIWDVRKRTVPLSTWKWTLIALPSSLYGWYQWIFSKYFDPRIFLLAAAFISLFFIGQYLWKTGHPAIGGGDILCIVILMMYVPVLPEISLSLFYIYPVLLCTLFLTLGWNMYHEPVPFILPFLLSHATLIAISSII